MLLDLNHQSGLIYGIAADGRADTTARVNAHIDAAITARNQRQAPRDYLGGSRIGEAKRLPPDMRQDMGRVVLAYRRLRAMRLR
jgi:hypothetical protein